MARDPSTARFAMVISRYHDDVEYYQWTDGPTVASRWAAHAIRTIRDLETCVIFDRTKNARFSLQGFRELYLNRKG